MENMSTLVSYQKQLHQEKEFITKLLEQIDQHLNCLQVEQMELKHAMNRSNDTPMEDIRPINKTEIPSEMIPKQLDLSLPVNMRAESEEEDDDEDV